MLLCFSQSLWTSSACRGRSGKYLKLSDLVPWKPSRRLIQSPRTATLHQVAGHVVTVEFCSVDTVHSLTMSISDRKTFAPCHMGWNTNFVPGMHSQSSSTGYRPFLYQARLQHRNKSDNSKSPDRCYVSRPILELHSCR